MLDLTRGGSVLSNDTARSCEKGEGMEKKDREVLELRQKILDMYDRLSFIAQYSWRIKKIKDVYDLDYLDKEHQERFLAELTAVYDSFCQYLISNKILMPAEEVPNE